MILERLQRRIIRSLDPLPIDIATGSCGEIENVVARLNETRGLKPSEKLTGANQPDPLVHHGAPLDEVAVFEKQQGLGGMI